MQKIHYDAFISYRHIDPDAQVAAMLARSLENYRIPFSLRKQSGKKRMGKVFLDHNELPTSSDLGSGIEAALQASDYLIVISSPEYLQSKWCMKEVDSFIAQGKREKILTILVKGDPSHSFPPELRFVPNPDGTVTEVEPLAADVRAKSPWERNKKLKVEKLRLLAPILGVGFDDLRRRHRERSLKMLILIALFAAIGGVAFGTYAYSNSAIIARQGKELQKTNDALLSANFEVQEKNKALADTNDALKNANTQLADTNTALGKANRDLVEANEILEMKKHQIAAQRDEALISQSRFLADAAQTASDNGNPMLGMLLSLEALPKNLDNPERPYTKEAEIGLRGALAQLDSNTYTMYSSSETKTRKAIEFYSYTNHMQRNYIALSSGYSDDIEIYSIETGALSSVLTKADRKEYSFSTSGDYAAYIKKMGNGTERLVVRDINHGYETYAEVKYPDAPQICSSGIGNLFSDILRVAVKNDRTLEIYRFRDGFKDGEIMTKLCSITTKKGISGYAWCPDGGRIILWAYGTLYVYGADDGALLAEINGTEGGFSANGRMIYAVDKGYLKLYDGSTYQLVHSFYGKDEKLIDRSQSLYFQQILRRFSPDGSLIVYPAKDGRLRLYSCETGEIIHTLSVPSVSLTWADWNFSGDRILAVGRGKTYIFSVKSGQLLQTLDPEESVSMAFFINESDSICAIAHRKISFWGASPGESVYFGDQNSTEFTFSKNGKYLYHLRNFPAYTAFAVDTVTGEKLKYFGQAIWFKETQDGKTLAVYRPENHIDLYEVGEWDKPYKTLHYDGGRDDYYYFYSTPMGGMSFSPDGKKLAVVNHIWGKIILFDVKTGGAEILLDGGKFSKYFHSLGIGLADVPIYWSPDGTKITAVYNKPYIDEYRGGMTINVKTGRAEEIPSHIHYEQSPDYRYFFKLNLQERKLRVYSALSEELLYTIKDCDWACFGYGDLLLTTDEAAKFTTVRQVSKGEALSTFEESASPRHMLRSWYRTSYDGKYISMISSDMNERYAVMRLTDTGEMIQKIPYANNIIWSPRDSRFVVDMSGTAMNSKLSYITHIDDLETIMKKAVAKLGGRRLSDSEREKYWLR